MNMPIEDFDAEIHSANECLETLRNMAANLPEGHLSSAVHGHLSECINCIDNEVALLRDTQEDF